MTDPALPTDEAVLQRRRFLRGGALVAAAAGGAVATSLAGGPAAVAADGDYQSVSLGLPPTRMLDTRTAYGRELIVGSSSKALDSKHRLTRYAWLDVAVFPADSSDIALFSAYVNLGSRASTKKGTLLVTEPGEDRSDAWTLHYGKGAEVNNSAIVGVGISDDGSLYTVRVYAGSATHVVLDLTGVSALVAQSSSERSAARTSGRAGAARILEAARSMHR